MRELHSIEDRPRPATNWAGVIFGLYLGVLAAYQQFKLPPVLPPLIDQYDYSRALAGGFMSVYALAGILVSLRAGALMQRRGALPFLMASFGLLLFGNIITLIRPESGLLVLLSRAIEGLAVATLAVAAPAIAIAHAAPHQRGLVAGLSAAWVPAGQLVANALAAVTDVVAMDVAAGWHLLWWSGVAFTLAAAVLTLRQPRSGMLAAAGGARGKATVQTGPPYTAAERRALLMIAALFGVFSAEMTAYLTWLPQYLVEIQGVDTARAAMLSSVSMAALLVLNILTGELLRRGLSLTLLCNGSLVLQALVWCIGPFVGSGFLGVALLVAFGIGAGITPTCIFALPTAKLGAAKTGSDAFGIIMFGRNLGVLIGPTLFAVMLEQAGLGWGVTGIGFGALTLVGVGLMAGLRQQRGFGA